jgi:hypothetical protein
MLRLDMNAGSTVTVFCTACGSEANVRSRMEYDSFDATHRLRCGKDPVLYRASVEDLLDLPPYWATPGITVDLSLADIALGVRIDHAVG